MHIRIASIGAFQSILGSSCWQQKGKTLQEKPMNPFLKIPLLAICAFAFLASSNIHAADWLTKKGVYGLLSGNTITGFYMKDSASQAMMQKRVGIKIKFYSDGSAEQTTDRASSSKGLYTEKGKWFVNEKGALCMTWEPENKKKCGRMRPISDGKYELVRKGTTFVYEKVIPGT
ncbi:MAG: hypothetical protein WBM59_08440 [Sedimenticolaceae bacterium]